MPKGPLLRTLHARAAVRKSNCATFYRTKNVLILITLSEQFLDKKIECGPMPNVMAALPNIGGALCSTPQSLADAHY